MLVINSTPNTKKYINTSLDTNDPEISVITPVYNGMPFLIETASCLAKQTFLNFEWVIVDDCSNDRTAEFILELAEKDNRVKPLFLGENSGPIVARNKGMDLAKGRFVAFLDADDMWTSDKLEKQIAFMKKWDIPLSYTSFRKIDSKGNIVSRFKIPVPSRINYSKLIESNCIPASSAMFDRLIVGEMRQDTDTPVSKDDFFFWLEMLKRFGEARGMKEDLFRLRVHKGSITSNKLEMAKGHWRMYRDIFNFSVLKSIRYFVVYSLKGFVKYLL